MRKWDQWTICNWIKNLCYSLSSTCHQKSPSLIINFTTKKNHKLPLYVECSRPKENHFNIVSLSFRSSCAFTNIKCLIMKINKQQHKFFPHLLSFSSPSHCYLITSVIKAQLLKHFPSLFPLMKISLFPLSFGVCVFPPKKLYARHCLVGKY